MQNQSLPWRVIARIALFRSLSAALVAAPLGWFIAGVLRALARDYYPASMLRPLYAPGDYAGEALLAGVVVGLAVALWTLGRTAERA